MDYIFYAYCIDFLNRELKFDVAVRNCKHPWKTKVWKELQKALDSDESVRGMDVVKIGYEAVNDYCLNINVRKIKRLHSKNNILT
jgi:hypothetical protein